MFYNYGKKSGFYSGILLDFEGTIGVAPLYERRMSFYHGTDFCGNIDCKDINKGKEIALPFNVDGLFRLALQNGNLLWIR